MPLVYRSGPAQEPVSVAEAKAHLRLETDADDALVASLSLTSRLHIEAALGLALTSQDFTLVLDRWPKSGHVEFPVRPVAAVSAVRVLAIDGTPEIIAPQTYLLDAAAVPPKLVGTGTGTPWPAPGRAAGGIEIDLTAGYGPTPGDVPAPIRQAILMLVAHWYEHRDPIEIGQPATAIPDAVSGLLKSYVVPRL